MDIVRVLDNRVTIIDGVAAYLELLAEKGYLDQEAVEEAAGYIDCAVQVLRRMQKKMEEDSSPHRCCMEDA